MFYEGQERQPLITPILFTLVEFGVSSRFVENVLAKLSRALPLSRGCGCSCRTQLADGVEKFIWKRLGERAESCTPTCAFKTVAGVRSFFLLGGWTKN
eukprot:5289880-Amphidinium_carterae.1